MNGLEFVASVIDALAWPMAIVGLFALFREQVRRAIDTMIRVQYGDFELELERQLSQMDDGTAGGGSTGGPEVGDSFTNVEEFLEEESSRSPRNAILEAWLVLEEVISDVAEAHGLAEPGRPVPFHELVRKLEEAGVLTDDMSRKLLIARRMRNEAVHHRKWDLSSDGARYWVNQLRNIANEIVREADTSD